MAKTHSPQSSPFIPLFPSRASVTGRPSGPGTVKGSWRKGVPQLSLRF